MDFDTYVGFVPLLLYPGADTDAALDACARRLQARSPDLAAEFAPFARAFGALDRRAREEMFLKTFEVQALCHLELGYVLFGEDYKRGLFLANMKEEQQRAGLEGGIELADHLANVLRLLPRLDDEELVRDLAEQAVIPALRSMLEGFDEARIRARIDALHRKHEAVLLEELNFGSPYSHLLRSILGLFEADFPGAEPRRGPRSDFIPIQDARDPSGGCAMFRPGIGLGEGA